MGFNVDEYNEYSKIENVLERAYQETLEVATKNDIDISGLEVEIKECFDTMYSGNWEDALEDATGNTILRFCQEDEFDQHVDQTEYNGWENVGYAGNHYVFIPNESVTYLSPDEQQAEWDEEDEEGEDI